MIEDGFRDNLIHHDCLSIAISSYASAAWARP